MPRTHAVFRGYSMNLARNALICSTLLARTVGYSDWGGVIPARDCPGSMTLAAITSAPEP
ncbi:hypothetical protein BDS110ZK25_84470 [Bradyrhizobium diazoefficiens]